MIKEIESWAWWCASVAPATWEANIEKDVLILEFETGLGNKERQTDTHTHTQLMKKKSTRKIQKNI